MSIITVTGANGHLGRLVVQHLLKKGLKPVNLRVSVRDVTKSADLRAQGIDVRHGDFNDFTSVRDAFAGSDSVLLISTDKVGSRIDQHLRAVQAAKEAGVKHLANEMTTRSPMSFLARVRSSLRRAREAPIIAIPCRIEICSLCRNRGL